MSKEVVKIIKQVRFIMGMYVNGIITWEEYIALLKANGGKI
jgi:hypothetical protein